MVNQYVLVWRLIKSIYSALLIITSLHGYQKRKSESELSCILWVCLKTRIYEGKHSCLFNHHVPQQHFFTCFIRNFIFTKHVLNYCSKYFVCFLSLIIPNIQSKVAVTVKFIFFGTIYIVPFNSVSILFLSTVLIYTKTKRSEASMQK